MFAHRHRAYSRIIVTAALIFLPCRGLPTTIVAIRTPEVFAIAADSQENYIGKGELESRRSVPKIFQHGNILYALSGFARDPIRGFYPVDIVAASLDESRTLQSMIADIDANLFKSLDRWLSRLKAEDPRLLQKTIEGDHARISVLLASFEDGQPVVIAIQLIARVDSDEKIIIRKERLACPGDCPDGNYTIFFGKRLTIKNYIAKHGGHFKMSPEDGAKFLVQLEIDANTPGVGPPINVVRLDKNGIKWLTHNAEIK